MTFEKKINVGAGTVSLEKTNLKDVLKLCNPSEQYVLIEKYGLISWKPMPMQQIWKKFDLSRERVRQISNKALSKIKRLSNWKKEIEHIFAKAQEILKKNNYIMDENSLIEETIKDEKITYNEALLLLSSDTEIYYIHRNKRFEKFFFLEPLFEDIISDINDTTLKILEENKSALSEEMLSIKLIWIFSKKFERNQSIKNILENENMYKNIFNISKNIYTFNGKVWLYWDAQAHPNTMKLKISYVLEKEWKHLHFNDIAEKVKETFNLKNVKASTIHNELVKNPEFINVWIWTYWLKKWWYRWENTLELLKNILKDAKRPMKVKEITKEVLKERTVQEVTILMVLQKNPDTFERVWKWIYKLKE